MTSTEQEAPGDLKLVDMQILDVVYAAANSRLAQVNETERVTVGAASTTLADIAREALLQWKPPKECPPRLRRARREGQKPTTFRFYMPRGPYDQIKANILACNLTVVGVVQDHMIRFARTGKY